MSSSSSLKILGWIVALVVAASGWLWGWKYKRIADGAEFSEDEKQLIDLQDQLMELTEENEELAEKIRTLEKALAL